MLSSSIIKEINDSFCFQESSVLVQVYIWYASGFVTMELMVTMMEFLYKFEMQKRSSFIEFIVEVAFLFGEWLQSLMACL